MAIGAEDDFVQPIPLGADETGDIYVIDPRLRDVRRFDSAGRFEAFVVRPGQGPGELRLPAQTYGMLSDSLWYSEEPTGRIHFVALDGTGARVEDTGWTPERLGSLRLNIHPLPGASYWLEARWVGHGIGIIRPLYRLQYYRARGSVLDSVYGDTAPGRSIAFDGGRTTMFYPGPPDDPVVFPDGEDHIVRIDRPNPKRPEAAVMFQRINRTGVTVRMRTLLVRSVTLGRERRDSIESAMVRGATWGGGRPLDRQVGAQISLFVAALRQRVPAFEEWARVPDASVWLRLPRVSEEQFQTWLVVDSLFTPIARALVPLDVALLVHRPDGSWWATINGEEGVQHVAQVRFDVQSVQSAGSGSGSNTTPPDVPR